MIRSIEVGLTIQLADWIDWFIGLVGLGKLISLLKVGGANLLGSTRRKRNGKQIK